MTIEQLAAYEARGAGRVAHGIPLKDALAGCEARGAVREGVAEGTEIEVLHGGIIKECRRRGWVYIHADPTRKGTTRPGTPDFIILNEGPRPLLVECKTRAGNLSKAQENFRRDAAAVGHVVHVVRSLEQFYQTAKMYLHE